MPTYEELRESAKRLNIYMFDFNHTLEEGSEIAITHVINSGRRMNGYTEIDINQVLELYGQPLDVFIRQLCTWVTDTESFSSELVENLFEYIRDSRCMKPTGGAVNLLRTLKERGDLAFVLSAISETVIFDYLELLGLRDYVIGAYTLGSWTRIYKELLKQPLLPDYVKSFLNQPNSVEQFKGYVAYLWGRRLTIDRDTDGKLVQFDRRFLIGDSESDVKGAILANGLIEEEWRHYSELGGVYSSLPKVESVFYNPRNKSIVTEPNHEIKHLMQVLEL